MRALLEAGVPQARRSARHRTAGRSAGLTNRALRELIAGITPGYSRPQMTYDRATCDAKALRAPSRKAQCYELAAFGVDRGPVFVGRLAGIAA